MCINILKRKRLFLVPTPKLVEGIYPFAAEELKRLISVINTNTTEDKDELIGGIESFSSNESDQKESTSVRVPPTNKITLPY